MGYCIAGDGDGMISIFEHGELISQVDAASKQDLELHSVDSSAGVSHGCSLVDVLACGRGFVTATKSGIVSMFTTGEQNRRAIGHVKSAYL